MSKTTIQIKNRFFGTIIYEHTAEDNDIRKTVEAAVEGGANLCDANLCDANLRGADLRGANLCDANLRGANLRGANLGDANLCDANLGDANLCDANLCDANLCDANLCDANLCDANLRGATIDYADGPDDYEEEKELVDNFIEDSPFESVKYEVSHYMSPTRWSAYWDRVLRITGWELKENQKTFDIDIHLSGVSQDGAAKTQEAYERLKGFAESGSYNENER